MRAVVERSTVRAIKATGVTRRLGAKRKVAAPVWLSALAWLTARRKQVPLSRQALHLEGAALGEFQSGAGDEIGDDARHQHLVRSRMRHHARCGVYGDAADILAAQLNLTGVQARAHVKPDPFCRRT